MRSTIASAASNSILLCCRNFTLSFLATADSTLLELNYSAYFIFNVEAQSGLVVSYNPAGLPSVDKIFL